MPIPVRKLSVKTSFMMKLKKRFQKQATEYIDISTDKKVIEKLTESRTFVPFHIIFWTCKKRKIFALVNWFSIVLVVRCLLEKFNKLETFFFVNEIVETFYIKYYWMIKILYVCLDFDRLKCVISRTWDKQTATKCVPQPMRCSDASKNAHSAL